MSDIYISKFNQQIINTKGDVSIYEGDEVKLVKAYGIELYISERGAYFLKESVEKNTDYWELKKQT